MFGQKTNKSTLNLFIAFIIFSKAQTIAHTNTHTHHFWLIDR